MITETCLLPECPCYKDTTRNKVGPATEEDIQVLTVRDGEGKTLQDARFVEILKSAKSRIKSATESLRGATSEWNISHVIMIIWSVRVQEGGLVRRPQEEEVEGSQLEC